MDFTCAFLGKTFLLWLVVSIGNTSFAYTKFCTKPTWSGMWPLHIVVNTIVCKAVITFYESGYWYIHSFHASVLDAWILGLLARKDVKASSLRRFPSIICCWRTSLMQFNIAYPVIEMNFFWVQRKTQNGEKSFRKSGSTPVFFGI